MKCLSMSKPKFKRVCVVGLGTVGLPTAKYIYERGFEVFGYDIRTVNVKEFPTTSKWEELPKDIDVYVITVSTGWDEKLQTFDFTALYDVCSKIAETIKTSGKEALVSIESTIAPGVSRDIATRFGLKYLVHVPHRYWVGDPIRYGVRQLRVFGALNEESKELGLEFYKSLDIPLYVCPSIEVAEMSKIVENAYRFVQIAFVEEIKIICDALGLDFEEVRRACNTKWNVQLLEARDGIHGHCLPKDIRYVKKLGEKSGATHLLKGAILADELYKNYIKGKK